MRPNVSRWPSKHCLLNINSSSPCELPHFSLKSLISFSLVQNDKFTSFCLTVFAIVHAYVNSREYILNLNFILLKCLCHFNYSTSHKNQEGKRGISLSPHHSYSSIYNVAHVTIFCLFVCFLFYEQNQCQFKISFPECEALRADMYHL